MKKIAIVLCLLSIGAMGFAQEQSPKVNKIDVSLALKAKGYEDKIVLRWGLKDINGWPFLKQSGVWIERIEMNKQNKVQGKVWKRLNTQPLLAWTEEQFKTKVLEDTTDRNLLVAAQAMYAKASIPNPSAGGLATIKDAAMEYENRFALAIMAADYSPTAADALGLRWEDKLPVDTTFKYVYRIYPALKNDKVYHTDTAYFIYGGFAKNEKNVPVLVDAVGKDRKIQVSWPKDGIINTYSAYFVERAEDGKNFKQINKRPLVFSSSDSSANDNSYLDSVPNYKMYYYRVRGIDAFGDMSGYSAVTKASATDQTAPQAAKLSAKMLGKDRAILTWKLASEISVKQIAGYIIKRGTSAYDQSEIRTEKMLPVTTPSFTDQIEDPSKGMFYQLVTIDTAGNSAPSSPVFVFAQDTIPPKPPTNLKGIIDTTGKVTLNWDMDYSDNITGYRIFISNSPTQTFSPITPTAIDDTTYIDSVSMRRLDKKIYYKIVAVDGNSNISKYSEILSLTRPDVLPPMPVVIGNYKVQKSKVWFEWSASPSVDVVNYQVWRKQDSDSTWKAISLLDKGLGSYTDSTVIGGHNYTYAVTAIDESKLSSPKSYPLQVKVYHNEIKQTISQLKVVKTDKLITLSWTNSGEKPSFYVIYKDNGGGLLQYKSVGGDATTFKESANGKVKYALKAVYADQTASSILEGEWVE